MNASEILGRFPFACGLLLVWRSFHLLDGGNVLIHRVESGLEAFELVGVLGSHIDLLAGIGLKIKKQTFGTFDTGFESRGSVEVVLLEGGENGHAVRKAWIEPLAICTGFEIHFAGGKQMKLPASIANGGDLGSLMKVNELVG